MHGKDRYVALSVLLLLVALWLGFLVHRSPRFAGSGWGGLFGVSGAILMLVPLVYSLAKRSTSARRVLTRHYSIPSLLQAHIWFSFVGALFALIHSGHKFQSALGIALTATMFLTVISGFIGQYYLRYVAEDIREKQAQLGTLWRELETRSNAMASGPLQVAVSMQAVRELLPIATATAELQYGVQFQERVRKLCRAWLRIHIGCSVLFYALLALHIWAGIQFGLRWFQ
jgi:hypothetical protein